MKNVPIIKLSEEVMDILEKYRDDIADGTDQAALKSATQCVRDVKSAAGASFGGTGKYASGWTKKQTETGRGKAAYTVYNRRPGLPHLLENGHALVNGGRVPGKTHIAPAAQKATDEFERAVEEVIRDAGG